MTLSAFITQHIPADIARNTVIGRLFALDMADKLPTGCGWLDLKTETGWEITKEQAPQIAPLILGFQAKPYRDREGIGRPKKVKNEKLKAKGENK